MTTANLAEALPRLQKLRETTRHSVSVDMEVWVREERVEVEWRVFLVGHSTNYEGPTFEAAIEQAEAAVGLGHAPLPEVILP